jgi:hypothetical protein
VDKRGGGLGGGRRQSQQSNIQREQIKATDCGKPVGRQLASSLRTVRIVVSLSVRLRFSVVSFLPAIYSTLVVVCSTKKSSKNLKMFCAESSDGERTVSPTAAATVRERRRLRLLKRRWNQGAANNNNSFNSYNNNNSQYNGGMVLSFSAFRRARRMRHQRRMTKEEYLRLKNMVPAVATQSRVSKVLYREKSTI